MFLVTEFFFLSKIKCDIRKTAIYLQVDTFIQAYIEHGIVLSVLLKYSQLLFLDKW
jgi:hypothetical protein